MNLTGSEIVLKALADQNVDVVFDLCDDFAICYSISEIRAKT